MQTQKTWHIFFDLDSTIVDIEGIVHLAQMKNKAKTIARLTSQAMEGHIPFENIALKRHEILKPTAQDLVRLSEIYIQHIIPKVKTLISELLKYPSLRIYILTGAYVTPTIAVAKELGIPFKNVYAQLWFKEAKKQVIETIDAPISQKILIGDGGNDLIAKPVVQYFICASYVVSRPQIETKADFTARTVEDLNTLITNIL